MISSLKRIQDAFGAGAIPGYRRGNAMQGSIAGSQTGGTLNWDMGADQQIPDIPHAGAVLISILLGIYLVWILGVSLYSTWTPRWMNPRRVCHDARGRGGVRLIFRLTHIPAEFEDFDKLLGWIGGATGVGGGGWG
ncbi:hypothetical protein PEXP_027610 [Penicillium expansum]|nr:hypothetical protein PEXP_027610 [Penicillium expansum]